jgi:hypothetical protein
MATYECQDCKFSLGPIAIPLTSPSPESDKALEHVRGNPTHTVEKRSDDGKPIVKIIYLKTPKEAGVTVIGA